MTPRQRVALAAFAVLASAFLAAFAALDAIAVGQPTAACWFLAGGYVLVRWGELVLVPKAEALRKTAP